MPMRTGPGEVIAFGGEGAAGGGSATAITGLTSKQVTFGGSSGGLAQNQFFLFDTTNAILQVGDTAVPNAVLPTDYQLAVVSSGPAVTNQRIFSAAAGNAPSLVFDRSRGTLAAGTSVLAGDVLGRMVFQGFDGAGFGNSAEIRSILSGIGANSSLIGGTLKFMVTSSATTLTPAMAINSSRQVGIGTTAPTAMLHVVTQTNNQNVVDIQTSNGGAVLFADSTGRVGIGTTTPAGVLQVNSGTTVVFTATTDNRFGVGTTAPTAPLDVLSTAGMIVSTAGAGGYFFRGGGSGLGMLALTTNEIRWQVAGVNEMTLTTVGLAVRGGGVTAPSATAALTVITTVNGPTLRIFATTAGNAVAFNIDSTLSTSKIGFWTTVGTTRPTSYTTAAATTVRTLPSTISTVAGLFASAERDEFNKMSGVLAAWLGKDARNYGLVG